MKKITIHKISRNAVDLTALQMRLLTEFSYTENCNGESSTLSFGYIEGAIPLFSVGDFILFEWGWESTPGTRINTGTLRIDRFADSIEPDVVQYDAIAWDYGLGLSTKSGFAYNNATFANIVATHANSVTPNLSFPGGLPTFVVGTSQGANDTKTIAAPSRLEMLRDMARQYNYYLSIKSGAIQLLGVAALQSAPSAFTILSSDLIGQEQLRHDTEVVRQVIAYHQAGTLTLTDSSVPASVNRIADLVNEGFYSSLAAATARANGEVTEINGMRSAIAFRIEGDTRFLSGTVFSASGNKWILLRTTHSVGAGGWEVNAEARFAA